MKKPNKQHNNTNTETNELKVGYPDISKADTKTTVILSLIVIVIIFLLSIFYPTPATTDSTTGQSSSTEVQTDNNNTSESGGTTQTTETPDTEENEPALFDMGSTYETSDTTEVFSIPQLKKASSGFQTINGTLYYLQQGEFPFTGWLNINSLCYYILENGVVATGWQTIDHQYYYFAENGVMQTKQWIDGKYLGADGIMVTNAVTPDGIYVGKDGLEDDSLGTTNSTEGLTDLKNTLEDMLSKYSGSWSIYIKDIENNEYLSINNVQYFSASLIKLYCAASAYELIENGQLEETERITSLMSQMISISDNDAFNLMVMACDENNSHVAGREVIQDYINREGYTDTTITSILVPTKYKAPSSPGRNYTTVEDCGLLLEKIYKGKCVNPESSEKFLDLLLNQTHINKIPSGLPEGTKCANKTGDTNEYQHDAAIVYSPGGDYIITVMSSNCGAAIPNIQNISKVTYEYFQSR